LDRRLNDVSADVLPEVAQGQFAAIAFFVGTGAGIGFTS
jgi:hypothetical protein